MKVLTFKKAMLLCWLIAIGLSTVQANVCSDKGKEFKKTINKSFPISADGTVALFNKFGKLNVHTWNQKEVKIDVTITVNAGDQSKANDIFSRIDIQFSNRDDFVKASTSISSNKKSAWWWGGSNNSDFDIDYEVYMPASCQLELKIHHGNAFIENLKGNADIEVRHSDLRAESFGGHLDLDVAHGDAEITNTKNADIDIAHGDISIKSADEVELQGRHSDIKIRNANELDGDFAHSELEVGNIAIIKLESKHDELEIGQVSELIMDAKYSDVEVEYVGKRANCQMEFGELNLQKVSANFTEIRLDGAHTNFDLDVEEGASYRFDAAGTHAGVDYPSGMKIKYEKDKSSSREVRGHMGNPEAAALIHVRMRHGDVDVDD